MTLVCEPALRDVPLHELAEHFPACGVHPPSYRHRPVPVCAPDWHHLLPREWQRAWTPPDAVVVNTAEYGPVWEPAGVYCTPLCHRNVHVGIVALVHAWTAGETSLEVLAQARKLRDAPRLDESEWATASNALSLWLKHGGDPAFLQAHHLWGQA